MIQNTNSFWVTPGPYVKANAYVSAFWFFYLDFRAFGIAVGSMLSGLFSECVFYISLKKQDMLYISLYLVLFYQLFYWIVRFGFANEAGALAFIYVILFWKLSIGSKL